VRAYECGVDEGTTRAAARHRSQQGTLLMVAAILLLGIAGLAFALEFAAAGSAAERERATQRALSQAREALIAYAADRAVSAEVGPGYLPCPDLDDDGWAESTCGSMTGDSGQAQRLGRLPWKTLGLADMRDADGERLWYAVSSKYKGLLNCAASRACIDMSPDAALGTISVRERSGALIHDGTVAEPYRAVEGGAVAVVIAPGAPLTRLNADGTDGARQRRDCAPGDCDLAGRCTTEPPQRAAHCDPANFLDSAPASGAFAGEDNADFVDRNDAAGRARNVNGFIHGPVVLDGGRVALNDRLAVISYRDVMPRVMARVAREVALCLRDYAARPENGDRYPWPAPVCAQTLADPAAAWRGEAGAYFGRIPDTPFAEAAARGMLERWWRAAPRTPEDFAGVPTRDQACHIAVAPDDAGERRTAPPPAPDDEGETAGHAGNAWWTPWKPFVFYALARSHAPASAAVDCADPARCVDVGDLGGGVIARGKHFAVIVAGAPLARDGTLQSRAAAGLGDARQWLEGANALLAAASSCAAAVPPCDGACNRVVAAAAAPGFNDVAIAFP